MFAAILRFFRIGRCACHGTITGRAKHSKGYCSTTFSFEER